MDIASVVVPVVLGFFLSVTTGLRAFVAPFALSLAGWMEWVDLGDTLGWLATPAATITFGTAILFELAADKIPALDHVMDVIHTAIKPAAGTVVAMSFMQDANPLVAGVAALATGGVIATGTHLLKAGVRVGSTCTTAGTCNPVVSLVEDAAAFAVAVLATWGVSALQG